MPHSQPTTRSLAGQTIVLPDVLGAGADMFGDAHPLAKLVAVLAILFVGLDLYGRWTGHFVGQVDVLGLNRIGQQINASQQTLSQQRVGVGGFNQVHSR